MSVQKKIDQLLAQRAAEWFEVYRTGAPDQHPAFIAWVSESPRHLEEFLEIAGRYSAVRDTLRSGVIDHEALLLKLRPKVTSLHPAVPDPFSGQTKRSGRRRWPAGLAAAGVIAAAIAGVWHLSLSSGHTYETQIGEQRVIQLTDGSMLTLNAASRVNVRMSESARTLRLLEGEALFKVAPDKMRPFTVHARGTTVRALGTQFNVYARDDRNTTVAVLEGRVEVTSEKNPPVVLGAGEAARVPPTGLVVRESNVSPDKAVSWRQRRLNFDGTPLEDIAMEFNRYNPAMKIRVVGIEPGSYTFTGSFDADDPRSLAQLLSRERRLVVDESKNEIVIRSNASE